MNDVMSDFTGEYNSALISDSKFISSGNLTVKLIYVTKNSITILHNNKQYLLRKGDVFIIFPYISYEFNITDDSEIFIIDFEPDFVEDFRRKFCEYEISSPYFSKKQTDASAIHAINELLRINVDKCETSLIKIKGWITVILGDLFFKRSLIKRNEKIDLKLIRGIIEYINEATDISDIQTSLMKQFGLSSYFLTHTFKQITNTPFKQFVTQIKLKNACRLISTTDNSMLTVVLECGFNSEQTFSRNFKKFIGISPKEYKTLQSHTGIDFSSLLA